MLWILTWKSVAFDKYSLWRVSQLLTGDLCRHSFNASLNNSACHLGFYKYRLLHNFDLEYTLKSFLQLSQYTAAQNR